MQSQDFKIRIEIANQQLQLFQRGELVAEYAVSTSRFGPGFESGSFRTPTGRFVVCEKIGAGEPEGMVFKSRIPTGRLGTAKEPADLVQTRILWLDGRDLENANTRERFIYIHGTNHEESIGTPASIGCIRMRNSDVVALFDQVAEGVEVVIQ